MYTGFQRLDGLPRPPRTSSPGRRRTRSSPRCKRWSGATAVACPPCSRSPTTDNPDWWQPLLERLTVNEEAWNSEGTRS